MKRQRFMFIAGESSGDVLASELVMALRDQLGHKTIPPTDDHQPLHTELAPEFFGAGGPRMAAAGVNLVVDMTQHAVVGLSDVLKKLLKFRTLFRLLKKAALDRQPDVIVCVDFSGFNRRWVRSLRSELAGRDPLFNNWRPKIVQYVSPQVWASRERRIYSMEQDLDLLLTLFPFEKAWYAARVPKLRVEFVGHPILDRYSLPHAAGENRNELLLLPGSRSGELARHLPVLFPTLDLIRQQHPTIPARLVIPSQSLLAQTQQMQPPSGLILQVGNLPEALTKARVAIASTGTVTMECAFFRVPTVALYKTSWSTYQIGKRIVKVKYLAMPNILADSPLFPEFIQDAATPKNLATATLNLLDHPHLRGEIQAKLTALIQTLGEPGASRRAAQFILSLQ